jgi:phage tail-like protein
MATAARLDPLTSFNFILDIQGMRAGFSEIGGLSTETDIVEYREGNEDITMRKLPGKRKYANLSPTARTCGNGARR